MKQSKLPTPMEEIEGIVGEIKAKLDMMVKDLRRQPEDVQRDYIKTNLLPIITIANNESAKKVEDISDEFCQGLFD
jgi:hypothetical protein